MKNLKKITSLLTLVFLFALPFVSVAQKTNKETAETINVAGSGITRTIEATGNENINIEGSDINVVIIGNCNTIIVTGAAIKVKAQSVKVIRIHGADCGVTYKSSPNKNGKAISSIAGAGSYATKIK
ncbi:DUF3060 domain-containing protein [Pedobacter frigidisoli]|uniref:DUF3060 domain-containing protein n=1 Tax=Pedobacter frigidisoli TaxID=2530455 RepID=A0A4R0P1C6_9SPHI|nr:DUF3060 domain-containing protein [Pedobacter frigidisoli]TCD10554.1 DUF3060 domain-containing protein [Pedobacter frigidisoli]